MNTPSISRRRLLQALAAAPLAVSVPSLAATQEPNRLLVLVFLYGGNDNYNTWVAYTDELYYKVRPNIAVPRDAVLKITPSHGFHPSLGALESPWCESCFGAASPLYLCDEQVHFLCHSCFKACPSCGKQFCRACCPRCRCGAAG